MVESDFASCLHMTSFVASHSFHLSKAMYGVYDGHGPAGHDCSDLSLRYPPAHTRARPVTFGLVVSCRKLCSAFLNDPDREKDPGAVLTKAQVFCWCAACSWPRGYCQVFLETQEILMKQGQFDTSGTTCTIVQHGHRYAFALFLEGKIAARSLCQTTRKVEVS